MAEADNLVNSVQDPFLEPDSEPSGPSLTFSVLEDPNRKDQLFSFRREPAPPSTVQSYRPSEQQLLREGKLGESQFSARLQQVKFGRFKGEAACLIVVRLDFAPRNSGWFRFRNATVEVEFEEFGDGGGDGRNGDDDNDDDNDDDDDDDDEEEDDYAGPLVLKYYPDLIRGHIQTAAETYGIRVHANVPAPIEVGGISAEWGISTPREGLHLVHGRLVGSPETRVKWTMNENEITKSGIYEQPRFAVVVRYPEERGFVMTLGVKATTYAGLAVMGKGGSKIKFTKGKPKKVDETRGGTMPGLDGGSIAVEGQTWTAENVSAGALQDLEEVDLETLTKMKAVLLGKQGPGGGRGILYVDEV